jgi:hypothetical protein
LHDENISASFPYQISFIERALTPTRFCIYTSKEKLLMYPDPQSMIAHFHQFFQHPLSNFRSSAAVENKKQVAWLPADQSIGVRINHLSPKESNFSKLIASDHVK